MFISDVTYKTRSYLRGQPTEHVVSAVFQFGSDRVPLISVSGTVVDAHRGLFEAAERELRRRLNEGIKLTVVGA